MLDMKLKRALLSLRTQPHGDSSSDTDISTAETQLGVTFSENYRDFLRTIGWGGIGHYEFFGVGSFVPEFLNLVLVTLSERCQLSPKMPDYLIPLIADGAGNHYCLDTRHNRGQDCPVVFWNHEFGEDQELEIECESLESWLRELVKSLK